MEDLIEFLSNVELFRDLTREELMEIAPLINQAILYRGQNIEIVKADAEYIYFIREGSINIRMNGKIAGTLGRYDSFGEAISIDKEFDPKGLSAEITENAILCLLKSDDILSGDKISMPLMLKLLKAISIVVSRRLRNMNNHSTEAMIRHGESMTLEFKSTLRLNLHTKKFGREIEHSALKSIAAFLNTKGGTLLIGVQDDQSICGIELDKFENDDHALLHLTNLIKERISAKHLIFINSSVEIIDSKKVIRVDVSPSNIPAYLTYNDKEYFFIRTGPSTANLRVSELFDYISNRFMKTVATNG